MGKKGAADGETLRKVLATGGSRATAVLQGATGACPAQPARACTTVRRTATVRRIEARWPRGHSLPVTVAACPCPACRSNTAGVRIAVSNDAGVGWRLLAEVALPGTPVTFACASVGLPPRFSSCSCDPQWQGCAPLLASALSLSVPPLALSQGKCKGTLMHASPALAINMLAPVARRFQACQTRPSFFLRDGGCSQRNRRPRFHVPPHTSHSPHLPAGLCADVHCPGRRQRPPLAVAARGAALSRLQQRARRQ